MKEFFRTIWTWIIHKGRLYKIVDSYIDEKGRWIVETKCSRLAFKLIQEAGINGFSIMGYSRKLNDGHKK